MAKKDKKPPDEGPLVKVVVYVTPDLDEWIRKDHQKTRQELETVYGPVAARGYSKSQHMVGIIHRARLESK